MAEGTRTLCNRDARLRSAEIGALFSSLYILLPNFTIVNITNAMRDVERVSCIHFAERSANDRHYVLIIAHNGCYSYLGRMGQLNKCNSCKALLSARWSSKTLAWPRVYYNRCDHSRAVARIGISPRAHATGSVGEKNGRRIDKVALSTATVTFRSIGRISSTTRWTTSASIVDTRSSRKRHNMTITL